MKDNFPRRSYTGEKCSKKSREIAARIQSFYTNFNIEVGIEDIEGVILISSITTVGYFTMLL